MLRLLFPSLPLQPHTSSPSPLLFFLPLPLWPLLSILGSLLEPSAAPPVPKALPPACPAGLRLRAQVDIQLQGRERSGRVLFDDVSMQKCQALGFELAEVAIQGGRWRDRSMNRSINGALHAGVAGIDVLVGCPLAGEDAVADRALVAND